MWLISAGAPTAGSAPPLSRGIRGDESYKCLWPQDSWSSVKVFISGISHQLCIICLVRCNRLRPLLVQYDVDAVTHAHGQWPWQPLLTCLMGCYMILYCQAPAAPLGHSLFNLSHPGKKLHFHSSTEVFSRIKAKQIDAASPQTSQLQLIVEVQVRGRLQNK